MCQKVYSLPGVRFMHKIRPVDAMAEVSVSGLPEGLVWNASRRLVEGVVDIPGEYYYKVNVENGDSTVQETVSLTVSPDLQQPTPFMGWLSWNVVEGDISDEVVRTVADAMVSTGLKDAGYDYLVIDDLWQAKAREEGTGFPSPDSIKFPDGMKAVADYVHSKGLKFGIYSDAGSKTCAGCFGSYGFEEVDAKAYAGWDVDLLKYDYCFVDGAMMHFQHIPDTRQWVTPLSHPDAIYYYICVNGAHVSHGNGERRQALQHGGVHMTPAMGGTARLAA